MQYAKCMHPVECYFWFIYVYSVLSLQICSASLLLIAGWVFVHGNLYSQRSLIAIAVVLTVVALVVEFHALLRGPSTASQVCFCVCSC